MAYSVSLSEYDGYPKKTSMRVWVECVGDPNSSYYTTYEVYDSNDDLVASAEGSVFQTDDNGDRNDLYKTFTSLDPGTDYYILCDMYDADTDELLASDEYSFTTESDEDTPVEHTVTLSRYTGYPMRRAMRVKVSCTGEANGSYYTYYELYTEDGTMVEEVEGDPFVMDSNGKRNDLYKTFVDLEPGSSYYIVVTLWELPADELVATDKYSFTTVGRPDDWEWNTVVATGQPVSMYESDGVYYAEYLTATEWNDFIDRFGEFLDYLDYTITSGSLTNLYVTAGDPMTTTEVNKVVSLFSQIYEIGAITVAPPNAVSSGTKIRASFFNGLRNSLNSIE